MAGFFLNVKSKGSTNTGGQGGKDGVTPDIQIGTVTTLEAGEQATVTREGTNENPIFNFGIPKGNIGGTGRPGEKGVDGIDGKSLEFNWNGTELGIRQEGTSNYQYVNLKGERGLTGERGEQGLPGNDGKNGLDGTNGRDGITPIKGIDYYTQSEKEELITEILQRIPNGNEVAY